MKQEEIIKDLDDKIYEILIDEMDYDLTYGIMGYTAAKEKIMELIKTTFITQTTQQ